MEEKHYLFSMIAIIAIIAIISVVFLVRTTTVNMAGQAYGGIRDVASDYSGYRVARDYSGAMTNYGYSGGYGGYYNYPVAYGGGYLIPTFPSGFELTEDLCNQVIDTIEQKCMQCQEILAKANEICYSCTPGDTIPCTLESGGIGQQTCGANGQWGTCQSRTLR